MKRILIIRSGELLPHMIREFGDFDAWFTQSMQAEDVEFDIADAVEGNYPDRLDYSGVILPGSLDSAVSPNAWMRRLEAFIRDLYEEQIPVLGVCFGHQILATALGGRVRRCIHGMEIGTVDIRLTQDGRSDPLFKQIPGTFKAQTNHLDEVEILPPGSVCLAANAHCGIQAFRVAPAAWGVQFHPEESASMVRAFIQHSMKRKKMGHEGHALRESCHDTPFGRMILSNYLDLLT